MRRLALCATVLWLAGCGRQEGPRLFKQLTPGHTGITFANTITTDDTLNVQSSDFVYNGGGVALGDIHND